MHRLIVQLKKPLNASFCEAVVNSFGECTLIPIAEGYCVVEGLKISANDQYFEKFLQFNNKRANKSFLGTLNNDIDTQLANLSNSPKKAFLSDFKPPKVILYSRFKLSENLWSTNPWDDPEF